MKALLCFLALVASAVIAADAEATSPASPTDAIAQPQTPKPPLPYREIEVSFANAADPSVKLAGTLSLPKGRKPFPAVLLVSGAGPQDRNHERDGHRPFQVLADALTRRGIAVLRVDDRGVGASTGSAASANPLTIGTDVDAAFDFLKTRREIDQSRVGLVGFSLGGMIVSRVTARRTDVAFVVSLSRPVATGIDFTVRDTRSAVIAAGGSEEVADARAAFQRDLLTVVKANPHDNADARAAIIALFEERNLPTPNEAMLNALLAPPVIDLATYDPAQTLPRISVPVLAVFGGQDQAIPELMNYEMLADGLRNNPHSTIAILPGLNHHLQTAETGEPDEYASIAETISPRALDLVGDWLVAQTRN